MAVLRAFGIEAALPARFGGRIFVRPKVAGEDPYPVAQFATFWLPADVGDFGGGAVTLMRPDDVLAVLFEYGPDAVGKALFARQGLPGPLSVADFRPTVLRRGQPAQVGTQWFFTEGGRPFTFYAVLGSGALAGSLVPSVNQLLARLQVQAGGSNPAAAPAAGGAAPWN
ncbi:MAG: hypothetical protein ACYCU7_08130 [Acidimicrobiales bacterium]